MSISFETLKSIAISDTTIQDNLDDLKSMFRNDIGSTRNMCRIRTTADLIDCLERHDALSEFNIEPLREIADEFGGLLGEAITCYQVPKELSALEPFNEYREIRLVHDLKMRLNMSGGQQRNVPLNNQACFVTSASYNAAGQQEFFSQPLSDEKRSAIYKLIAKEIGILWRSLGRELDISEGAMDEIEIQYPRDLKSRVFKMFKVFEENESVDSKEHLLLICRALDECRRKDLRRQIESIMSL